MNKFIIVECSNAYRFFKSMNVNGDVVYCEDEYQAKVFDTDIEARRFRNENLGYKTHSIEEVTT